MLTIMAVMAGGILTGYLCRGRRLQFVPQAITVLVCLLLLFLGFSVGADTVIMDHLSTIGLDALSITLGGLAGSVLLAALIYNRIVRRKDEN